MSGDIQELSALTGVFRFGLATLEAVRVLTRADLWTQALVVLYSGIDTLAWANKEDGDVTRSDFCVVWGAFRRGVLLLPPVGMFRNVIRITPPLTISHDFVAGSLAILDTAMAEEKA